MARLFFALWPDEETRNQLYNVSQQYKDENVKLVKKSNLHMTLEFLGELTQEKQQELTKKISHIKSKPFKLELTHVGFWKKPQVLWIGSTHTPEALKQLVNSIKTHVKQLEIKTDDREYRPHVTIARKAKQLISIKEPFHITWQVNSFALVVSNSTKEGVEYKVIKVWGFRN